MMIFLDEKMQKGGKPDWNLVAFSFIFINIHSENGLKKGKGVKNVE